MNRTASFVVRVVEDRRGRVSGIVERVATGAKEPFGGLGGIGQAIGTMLRGARPSSAAGAVPARSPDDRPRVLEPSRATRGRREESGG